METLTTLVDNAAPITFGQLAHRFHESGLTATAYQSFRVPLSFEDVTNPALADEIVGYRNLVVWFNSPLSFPAATPERP